MIIKTLRGKTHYLDVDQNHTIFMIKTLLYHKGGIPPRLQNLIFNNKRLVDNTTLSDNGIRNNDVVFMTLNI